MNIRSSKMILFPPYINHFANMGVRTYGCLYEMLLSHGDRFYCTNLWVSEMGFPIIDFTDRTF